MKTESILSLDELEQLESLCLRHENATTATERDIQQLLTEVTGRTRAHFLRELLWQDIEWRQRTGESVEPSAYTFSNSEDTEIVREVFDELAKESVQQGSTNAALSQELPIRYRRVEEVGRGGIGSVWRVEDLHSQRPLAIKTLRRKFRKDRQANFRLEREAKLTGMLQHPGIPPVHDHGVLADGSCFFAMKLIDGETLEEILKKPTDGEAPSKEAISVFEQVAQTMAYAHSKGVIHRDLKPQNIMVGQFAEVQVMDWGMAKRLNSNDSSVLSRIQQDLGLNSVQQSDHAGNSNETVARANESSIEVQGLTRVGDIMGTPRYMAPEQARGEVASLDARTDVFALGAILFEILTGTQLYANTSVSEILQKVATGDLSDSQHALEKSAAAPKLIKLCQRCLAAAPADRPANASEIAQQVREYFSNAQQRAKEAEIKLHETAIRVKEETKRRKTFSRMMMLVAGVFAIGLAGVIWQWNKANKNAADYRAAATAAQENAKKQQEAAFLAEASLRNYKEGMDILAGAFESANPNQGGNSKMMASDVLKQAYQALTKSEIESNGRMRLLTELAKGFMATGEYDLAIEVASESARLHKEYYGDDHPETIDEENGLGSAYLLSGRFDDALPILEKTFDRNKKIHGLESSKTISSMSNLAGLYQQMGQEKRALKMFEALVPLTKDVLGESHPEHLTALNNLGQSYSKASDPNKAIKILRKTVSLNKAKRGIDHPETLKSMLNLAQSHMDLGQLENALSLTEEGLKLCKIKLGDDHPLTILAVVKLGRLYNNTGRSKEGAKLLENALALQRNKIGRKHPECMHTMMNLAIAYMNQDKLEEAAKIGKEVLELIIEIHGEDHPDTNTAMNNLAMTFFRMERFEDALPYVRDCLEWQKRVLGKTNPQTILGMNNLLIVLIRIGRLDEALAINKEKLELCMDNLGESHFQTWMTMHSLSHIYLKQGRLEDAFAMDEEMLGYVNATSSRHRRETLRSLSGLTSVYEEANEVGQALKLNETSLKISRSLLGKEHPNTIKLMDDVARGFRRTKQFEKAISPMEEALELHRRKLGDDKDVSLNAMNELAHVYEIVGRASDAEELLQDCLKMREKLHPDDWRTFDTQSQLGGVLLIMDKMKDSADLINNGFKGLESAENIPEGVRSERLIRAVKRLVKLAEAQGDEKALAKWQSLLDDLAADS